MKRTFIAVASALVSVMLLLSSCGAKAKKADFSKNDVDSASYAIGFLNGAQYLNYLQQDSTINVDELIQGFVDAAYQKGGKTASYMQGYGIGENFRRASESDTTVYLDNLIAGFTDALKEKALINQEQANSIMEKYQAKMQQKQLEEQQKAAQEQIDAEKKVLDELANDSDIQKTESGLMYKITELGTGVKPAATDTVTVHYKGTDVMGNVFDSSYDRDEPATFPLDGVIAGWTEGFQLMPEGSTFTLWIPGSLAYGEAGTDGYGRPTGLLKFECQLIKVSPRK